MDVQDAIDLGREAVMTAVLIGSPLLLAAMAVGLIVGLVQAVTQIQEQSLAFVPKLVVMVLVLSLSLPWLIEQLVQYSHDVITNIPSTL